MNIADQHLVKKMNQQLILHEIIKNSPISRAQLSITTGLNKSTISSQVNSLIKGNIIFEIGQGQSSGGRRPVMLMFNKNAGYVIGTDVGVNYINVLLTDLEGNIVYSDYKHIEEPHFELMRDTLFNMIRNVMEHMPPSPYGLIGIGIGVPGLVDNSQKVLFTPNMEWGDIHLKSLVEEEFHVPVFVENEANAGALGEKLFGSAKNFENIIYVSVNIGIGIGIIINNELYRGVQGFSGEMGHMSIDFTGPRCNCGNRGCWELYASERVLVNSLLGSNKITKGSWEEVIELAQQNDIETLSLLENFGFHLGIGLTNILNTFDPELIIIRNNIVESHPIVLNSVQNTVAARAHAQKNTHFEFMTAKLGKDATAIGASAIVIKNFVENLTLAE